jgi:hypothetical protein
MARETPYSIRQEVGHLLLEPVRPSTFTTCANSSGSSSRCAVLFQKKLLT